MKILTTLKTMIKELFMRTGSNEIQNELNQTQASLENAKQQLKQFEEDERNATTKEAAIHAKRNQDDTEVGISFDKNKIKNLRKDLLTAKEREEELAHKKKLKDAQNRVTKKLKEIEKLDKQYNKHAKAIAKVLEGRAKAYNAIGKDVEFLCENDLEVNFPEHVTRESKSIYNSLDPHARNPSYIEHVCFNRPVQYSAVIPSINGSEHIYSFKNKPTEASYLCRPSYLYTPLDIIRGNNGSAIISSSK